MIFRPMGATFRLPAELTASEISRGARARSAKASGEGWMPFAWMALTSPIRAKTARRMRSSS
jgi:hypothetical protein